MIIKDQQKISRIYNYLLHNNPERLEVLADAYANKSGYLPINGVRIVDGLDAIINFVVYRKYSTERILYGSL